MLSEQNPDPPPDPTRDMRGRGGCNGQGRDSGSGGKRRWHTVFATTGGDGGRGGAAQKPDPPPDPPPNMRRQMQRMRWRWW